MPRSKLCMLCPTTGFITLLDGSICNRSQVFSKFQQAKKMLSSHQHSAFIQHAWRSLQMKLKKHVERGISKKKSEVHEQSGTITD
ncbi:hypothetical protein VNO78_18655 [Psophocarpus tetragonolobus]|uniref:Uncharacterized protein n=1 Tax=Psophocarpus tetragonolobus TaxID=3891 RepID=A0AAN9SLA3_PSOTE